MLLAVLFCSFGTGYAILANNSYDVSTNGGFQQSDDIRLIYEYVLWRNLGQVVVLDAVGKGRVTRFAREVCRKLSEGGIYAAVFSNGTAVDVREVVSGHVHRLGVILLVQNGEDDEVIQKASEFRLFQESQSWFVVTNTASVLVNKLKSYNLELNSDLVLVEFPILQYQDNPHVGEKGANLKTTLRNNDKKKSTDGPKLYGLYQIYKVRPENETSLIVRDLGSWDSKHGFTNVKGFLPVELRNDFYGFPLVIGLTNFSLSEDFDINVDIEEDEYIQDFVELIVDSLNASVSVTSFAEIGFQIHGNKWSELLGAVIEGKVDLAVEIVPITFDKLDYMTFSHPIFTSSRNMYLHPAKESIVRKTYRMPFSGKLVGAVFLTMLSITLTMAVVYRFRCNSVRTHTEFFDSLIWTCGVLTMQGSIYNERTTAGRIITLFSLIFALMIFNSYSAFITSVLSVRMSDIRTLDDIFHYGYDIIYVAESEDEIYLQGQTNELTRIYISGYKNKITNIEEGLLLAATQKYALFASGTKTRKILNALNPRECRCMVQEYTIPQTKQQLAFPLSPNSAYNKIINLSIFRLMQSGSLNNLRNYMYSPLPICQSNMEYVSAELSDLMTAFYLFFGGIIASLLVIVFERIFTSERLRRKIRFHIRRQALCN